MSWIPNFLVKACDRFECGLRTWGDFVQVPRDHSQDPLLRFIEWCDVEPDRVKDSERHQTTLSREYVFNVFRPNKEYLSVVPCCLRILSTTRPGGFRVLSTGSVYLRTDTHGVNVTSTPWDFLSGGTQSIGSPLH